VNSKIGYLKLSSWNNRKTNKGELRKSKGLMEHFQADQYAYYRSLTKRKERKEQTINLKNLMAQTAPNLRKEMDLQI
jgi:hypothetical protein